MIGKQIVQGAVGKRDLRIKKSVLKGDHLKSMDTDKEIQTGQHDGKRAHTFLGKPA